jgi:hypothetical protein
MKWRLNHASMTMKRREATSSSPRPEEQREQDTGRG